MATWNGQFVNNFYGRKIYPLIVNSKYEGEYVFRKAAVHINMKIKLSAWTHLGTA